MKFKKVITSFASIPTAEGETISYTYSMIDDNGNKVKDNVRATLVLVNDEQIELVAKMKTFLLEKVPQ